MSLIRIFFNPLDGSDKQEYPIEPGTPIIDFLTDHFPSGFDGCLRVFAGADEVAIEDLDRLVSDEEQVTMLVMPSGAETLGAVLINALISVAIGYVISLIFPPSSPPGAKYETESPVYSLNASRNQARLGDPVECHYGTVSYPPSYASAPYIWYSGGSNNMYIDELLCLGHGEFEINAEYKRKIHQFHA